MRMQYKYLFITTTTYLFIYVEEHKFQRIYFLGQAHLAPPENIKLKEE